MKTHVLSVERDHVSAYPPPPLNTIWKRTSCPSREITVSWCSSMDTRNGNIAACEMTRKRIFLLRLTTERGFITMAHTCGSSSHRLWQKQSFALQTVRNYRSACFFRAWWLRSVRQENFTVTLILPQMLSQRKCDIQMSWTWACLKPKVLHPKQ